MAYEQRDNSGIISKNKYKTLEKHPEISGKALVNGVEYRVAGWEKTGSQGKFYSLLFTPNDQSGERASAPTKTPPQRGTMTKASSKHEVIEDEIDDEIPF